jgi:hypothetical protein
MGAERARAFLDSIPASASGKRPILDTHKTALIERLFNTPRTQLERDWEARPRYQEVLRKTAMRDREPSLGARRNGDGFKSERWRIRRADARHKLFTEAAARVAEPLRARWRNDNSSDS